MSSQLRALVLERSQHWLDREICRFDPFQRAALPPEAEQTALVEIALVAMTLRRRARCPAIAASLGIWLDAVAAAYERPAFHETVFRGHKHAFSGHLLLWLALSPGRDLPVTAEQLQTLVDQDSVTATERLPFRLLELRYLLDLGGFRHRLPGAQALADRCILAARFNPVDALDQDIYALTHAAFYLSDFGVHPVPAQTCTDHIRQATRMLLVMAIRRRHWDLTAELLLTLFCLGDREDALTAAAWCALAGAQEADGSIPENTGGGRVESQDPHERFLRLYHRTIAALLAAALCGPAEPA